nr:MAG TPA: Minor structural protein 4 [Caudoviricetes sp.]
MADQKKTYTLTTATVPARPRSKTRREGEGLTTGGASAIVESATAGNAQRAAHSETANEAAHAAEAVHALNADNAKNATHADEATHAAHAETATSATTSEHSNAADTATRAQSAQTADHAATAATADRATHATEAETLRTPNFADSLNTGAGARIDAMGNAEFQSMAVRGFFRAAEYQINRIALSEGDVFHTENGLVKSAEQQRDGRWKVVLQERFQGDVTGFRAGDVLRGAYNSVGTSGGAAEIRTSWLRVEAVDAKAGTLTASLYADNQTPEGRNAPPVPLMRLARWGNTTDPERQSHIVESATDGRIVRRVKVSAPIVDGAQSDGFVVGKLPAWLREHFGAAVADASDYVFARGIITQNILRYTPAGRPLAERVDRGLWSASSRYFYEEQNPETGAFEISRVWHEGALYELARGGNGNTAPAAQSTHWTLIQAKPKDGRDGDAGKSAPPTGANLIDGTSFRSMEEVRRWENFDRFTFDPSQTDRVHPLAQAVCALKDLNWIKGSLKIAGLLRPNTTYTISIYSKGAGGILAVQAISKEVNRYISCPNVDRQKWTRYAYTFTTPETIPDNAHIFLGVWDMLAKTYFSALKLEEGEEATAWCLSENDKTGTPAANPNLWHCTDYVTRPHFTKGYLDRPYASILPGGVDGDNYFHIEGNNEERVAHVMDTPFGNRYPRGTWYTISFKCRGSGTARFHCYPGEWKKNRFYFPRIKKDGIDGIGQGYLILYFRLTKEWVTHSLSFFYDEEEDDLPKKLRTLFSLPKSEGNYLDICHPKMETGEFATPWCLSEMDKKGDPGRGVSRMRAFYMLTTERDAPQPDTSEWTETAPQPTKERPWLWSYERSEYTDGGSDQTVVRLIGHYGKDGTNGTSIRAQYSADAQTWHDDFAAGDVWMRTGNGTTWGGALRVVGESGADGKSPVYDFAASSQLATASSTTAPTIRGTWQDAPPTLRDGEVLWYRLTAANGKITYGRLSGEKGTSIRAQYSADARTWHDDFAVGDVWMRTGNGTTWGGALRVVGESGTDGKSPVYDFAASSQLATASGTTAPTIRGTWQDAPPTLQEGEVLWYRLTAANGKITYGRLSGRNSYIHIAYANSADGAEDFTKEEDLGRGGEIEFSYFGIYADFDEDASQDFHDYVWTRLRGVDGKDGLTPNANLLDDTDFKNLGRKECAWGVGTVGEEPIGGRANADLFPPSVSGCYPALCAINPGTKQGEFAQLWQNIGRLIPGRTYTFSVYVRGASDAWLVVYPNPTEHFHPNTVKPDEWTRVSITFTAPKTKATEDTLIILRAWHREEQPHKGFAKNVVWCAPKLEEGGVPTPWTPSRNDLRGNDGTPGTRGAVVRPLGDYDKLPTSTVFESGHTGEQYVDVVLVRQGAQVQFYQCKQPHTKSADKAPAADSEWWELGMYQGFIATDLLLAERSLIKNLQVENVVGRDANGNTTFDLDASTGTAYIGGTATFAGFTRRRPVVITPENWKEYGGEIEDGVIYLNPFHVGTYVIFRGDFGTLRPTINTGGGPLNDGAEGETPDNSQAMRYYGAQFMVFNDLEPRPNTLLTVGGLTIGSKQTAIFTMLGRKRDNPTLWWKGELVGSW